MTPTEQQESEARIKLSNINKKLNKLDRFSDEAKKLFAEELAIKVEYQDNFGTRELTKLVLPKKRRDGLFKASNSKGNGYGNL